MFELRGIEIGHDAGGKYVKIIARIERVDKYVSFTKTGAGPVNRGLVRAWTAQYFNKSPNDLNWPHHIEVIDI